MNKVLVALLALTITNCGWKNAYDDIHDLQDKYNDQQRQLDELNQRVLAVELAIASEISSIANMQSQIDALEAELDALGDYARFEIQDLWRQIFFANNKISILIVDLVALRTRVEGLEASDTSVSLLDPCGPTEGFNEVLVRMASGKVVAYFQKGNNRFLTVLIPGLVYETTDGSRCEFSVDAQGNLL